MTVLLIIFCIGLLLLVLPDCLRLLSRAITIGRYQGLFEVLSKETERASNILSTLSKEKEKKDNGKG